MGVMALTAFAAEKTFTLKFSETDLNKHYQKLSVIRQIVDNSNLSHQEVDWICLFWDRWRILVSLGCSFH